MRSSAAHEKFESFPLTDTQQAYLLGRSDLFELGNVTTHAYFEFEGVIDVERLCRAWQRLIERHDMLRTVILPEANQQRVLPRPPEWSPELIDLRELPAADAAARVDGIRARLSHEVRPAGTWPLFNVVLARLPEERTRIYVSIDGLICDYASWHVLFTDLSEYYEDPEAALPPLTMTFRDYVLAAAGKRDEAADRKSEQYWLDRIPELPAAPQLPLAADPATVRHPRFVRRAVRLPADSWTALKRQAGQAGMTPSALVIAAFAEILTAWSTSGHFTLNVPRMNRLPLHEQVNQVVGEFATFSLLEVDNRNRDTFTDRARRIQRQLWHDLAHHQTSGVRVLRELMRFQGGFDRALMPVVLTSTLAWAGGEPTHLQRILEPVYGISQTPQVYLDVQIDEQHGELLSNWDAVEELFPPGLLDDMFAAYTSLLERLSIDETAWSSRELELPAAQRQRRTAAAGVPRELPNEPVHRLFLDQVARGPERTAVVTTEQTLTYAEVFHRAVAVAHRLSDMGARPDMPVAIVLDKGWEQVVAVYGTLFAGAAYLPIDPALPAQRIADLLAAAGAELVITRSSLCTDDQLPPRLRRLDLNRLDLDGPLPDAASEPPPATAVRGGNLLYVLFTSGSTGTPKGVMIEHRGMLNALRETIDQFAIGPGDRCLGLTALHHDMSAFDILGVLGAGGTLVLPEADGVRDAAHWADLIAEHQVTIWNSVPAMADMLVAHLGRDARSAESLRLAFLGGDWIPLYLPRALTELARQIHVVSVGGPTETTLWNIWYPIDEIDPSRRSVPYGKPIANTRYYILSDELRHRPDGVVGEMYCAGVGLARGYLNDPHRTAESFLLHPDTGERLYRTGDLGRFLPDGNIEFVGRADTQVKIRGQRIELGEIETALAAHSQVAASVVVPIPYDDRPGHRGLAGFVTPADTDRPMPGRLRTYLRDRLPAHMLPVTLRCLDQFPLTRNGKVDRVALLRMGDPQVAEEAPTDKAADRPTGENWAPLEELLAMVWSGELGVPVGGHDFFELGGDSLQATRILSRLRDIFEGEDLPLRSLFTELTVAGMARVLRNAETATGRLDTIAQVHLDVERLSPDQVESALQAASAGHVHRGEEDEGGHR